MTATTWVDPTTVTATSDRPASRAGRASGQVSCSRSRNASSSIMNGSLQPDPTDDKVWGRLVEQQIPLGIHVSLATRMPTAPAAKLPGYGRFCDAPNRMIEMIFAGIFDRFPDLDVVFAEVDFGWVPYAKEQIDNNSHRLDPVSRFGLAANPSEYIERHFHFGFMTDIRHPEPSPRRRRTGAVVQRLPAHQRGLGRLVAHHPSAFSGVPPEERHLILAGNSQRLDGFGRT